MKNIFNFLLVICLFALFMNSFSCSPDPVIETETVTVRDTIIVNTTDTVFVSLNDTIILTETDTLILPKESKLTNFILIRHAEVSGLSDDPALSQAGRDRAEKLANMLSVLDLDRVYSTDWKRTSQTATPTAENQGLDLTLYGAFDHDEIIDDVLTNVNEGQILIVGHGNTTANFLNALTGTEDYPDLAEDAYDNLFIVNTRSLGDSEVVHLKY